MRQYSFKWKFFVEMDYDSYIRPKMELATNKTVPKIEISNYRVTFKSFIHELL